MKCPPKFHIIKIVPEPVCGSMGEMAVVEPLWVGGRWKNLGHLWVCLWMACWHSKPPPTPKEQQFNHVLLATFFFFIRTLKQPTTPQWDFDIVNWNRSICSWRGDSSAQSSCWSRRGPGFSAKHPHGVVHLTQICTCSSYSTPLPASMDTCTYMVHIRTPEHAYICINSQKFKWIK